MRGFRSIRAVLTPGLGVFLLIGCAELPLPGSAEMYSGTKSEQIQQTAGYPDAPGQVVHVQVPFFPDDSDQCGPATLASLLTYWGVPSDPMTMKKQIYSARLGGTRPIDL